MKVARATLVFRTIACAIVRTRWVCAGPMEARWSRFLWAHPPCPVLCLYGSVVAPLAHYEFTPYMCLQCAFIVESADGETFLAKRKYSSQYTVAFIQLIKLLTKKILRTTY